MLSRKLLVSAISTLLAAPMLVSADSDIGFGGAGTNASADLEFQIVIPQFVFFRVGTAGALDRVDFDLGTALAQPGTGVSVDATGGVGDGADGDLDVEIITNATGLTIGATGGDLSSGSNLIPFTDITAADGGDIPVPAFGTAGVAVPGVPGTLNDTWSYTYNNDTVYPPGTYAGTVTYTVTTL
jgi:hypothetical protein